jgi:hypothetical protein
MHRPNAYNLFHETPNVCEQKDTKLRVSFITSYLGNRVHGHSQEALAVSFSLQSSSK